MNANATRFTQIFSLDFDQAGVVASASIQILLLEKSRISRKTEGETTYHIMNRLLCGVEGLLRKELFLDNLSGNETNFLMSLLQKHEDKQRAQQEFHKTCAAFGVLGIGEADQKVIFSVLAAIFHLGCAGAVKGELQYLNISTLLNWISIMVFQLVTITDTSLVILKVLNERPLCWVLLLKNFPE